jgi:hypothetical protein
MEVSQVVHDFMGTDPADCLRCGADTCDGSCARTGSTVPTPTLEPGTTRLRGYSVDELSTVEFPRRKPLLSRFGVPVLRSGNLAEVYAPRGIGKTWFLQTLALVASSQVDALGFEASASCRVLFVDGEMAAEEIQGRFARLSEILKVKPGAQLRVIAADWQDEPMPRLDTPEGKGAIEAAVKEADLVIVDNRSCLFDPESEKDPSAWTPAQDWLLSLRRRGKAVVLAHHSNRQGGARGHSKPEDVMDVLIKLTRPEGYSQDQGARFLVEWEKARGVYGSAVAPFIATLRDDGWGVESAADVETDAVARKIIDYLAIAAKVDEKPKSASAAVRGAGVNKAAGLRAFERLTKQGRVVSRDGYVLA